nr:diguanylate cyclase [Candidatus Saccharibacteria bacterium]
MELGKDSWMDMANRLRNGGPSAVLARFALMLAGNAALADLLEHAANSDKDSLTHIRNRGALEEDIKELLLSPESGALIVIDLVNFGQVNNQRGQSGGDKLLQIIAEGLTRVTSRRRNDIIYTQHS